MALRFWNEHQSRYTDGGATWRIEIWDSSFVGEEYEFKVANGVRKEYRADGDNVFSPILGSSVTFQMEVEDTTHEALITDLAGAPEGRFTVALYVDTVFDWAGVINSPEISIEDHTYSYGFSITAVDGLALLKNYEYRQAGTDTAKWDLRYTGIDKLSDIVLRCIQKLPHVVTHFTGSTKFLVSAVNWYAVQHDATPVAAAYDPLYYTEIDNRFAATGQSSGNAKFLSCYEVLHHILRAFGARIGLFDGYFLIEQVEHRAYTIGSNDNYSRSYEYDGTGPTANTLTADQDVGLTEAIKPLGGTYSFERPVFSARVTQNVNSLQNLLAGAYFDSGTVETVTVENVFADGTDSYIRFTGNLEWTFENLGVGAPGSIIFIARFRLKMLFDAKYAVRVVTYDNYGGWTVTAVSWSGSLGYIEIPIVLTVPPLTETWTGQSKIDFLFPNASDFTQGDTEFSLEFIEINYYILGAETLLDPSDYALDWTLRDPYCGIVLNPKKIKLLGLPPGVANPKKVTYEVFGGSTNTQTEEIDTYIGDKAGTVTNQWGGLLFDNAGTYEYTELWGSRNGARTFPLAQLLAKRTVDFYYYPKKIFRGTIVGTTIVPQTPLTYDGTTYVLKSGSLQTDRAEFTGEWVEIEFTAAELTYGPAEYDTGEYEKTSAGGGGSGGGGGSVDNGGAGTGSGSPGGNGIYGGSGTVADGTVAALADDFEFTGGDTSSLTITTGTATGGQFFSDFNGASLIYRDAGNNTVTASAAGVAITTGGSAGDKLLVTGLADIEYSGTDPALTVLNTTSNTATVQDVLRLQANSSGTPAAGFGAAILFQQESSTTDDTDAVRLSAIWTTATHASRVARFAIFASISGVMTEIARFYGSSVPQMSIGGGSTAYFNNGISTGTTFSIGASANQLNLGGSSGTTSLGGGDGIINISRNTATTNAVVPINVIANTTGTAANGLGPQLLLQGESSTTASQDMGAVQAQWTDVTHATRASKLVFQSVYGATLSELFTLAWTTATANTASITTTNSNTNVGVALVPKGTGALTAAIPEGSATGGNARGQYAVDWQLIRTNNTDVASGNYSTIPGGRRCEASGTYSFATGFRAVASGAGSVAFGGSGAFSTGSSATGDNSFAFGTGADATATNAIAMNGDASAQSAVSINSSYANGADKYGMVAIGGMSHLNLFEGTLGTGAQELFLDGSALRATIPADRVWVCEVRVLARVGIVGNGTVAASDIYAATYKCVIANKGGTTALVGAIQADMAAQFDANMATATFTIAADNANDALAITYNPGALEGTTTQTNVYATIWYNEF